ncbi:hypothetical protein BDZ97DRAFT_1783146 [Flammula alnicola]|nr:hypothetical protein BDZ97DRAFT_1783146 [Flammula alnicola]
MQAILHVSKSINSEIDLRYADRKDCGDKYAIQWHSRTGSTGTISVTARRPFDAAPGQDEHSPYEKYRGPEHERERQRDQVPKFRIMVCRLNESMSVRLLMALWR